MPSTRRSPRGRAAVAAGLALAVSGLVLTASTAAQGNETAKSMCNEAHPMADAPEYTNDAAGWPQPIPGDPGGTLYVYYEGEYGYNCAVVIANGGAASYVDVGLRHSGQGGQTRWDSGAGSTAGPLLLPASGICIDVTGAVGERSFTRTNTNCGD